MRVWRITRSVYAANPLSGEGSAHSGNRWNSKGMRMGYASTSRSLAVLEMLVHVTRETAPADAVLIPIDVPDAGVSELDRLPAGWNDYPYSAESQAAGDRWIRASSSLALLVPSAVLRAEHNLLINPAHPDFTGIRIHPAEVDAFDPRLFPPTSKPKK